MKIDTSKPLEVVANWDSSLVWMAELVGSPKGSLRIEILERHTTDPTEENDKWPIGTDWHFSEEGKALGKTIDLTLRNVKEPSELTWEDIKDAPEWKWARDLAMSRVLAQAGKNQTTVYWSDPAMRALALMIARHEEQPPEPFDPALPDCGLCGSKCDASKWGRDFDDATIWMCSNSTSLGGDCRDGYAYLTEEAWTRVHTPSRALKDQTP